MAQSFADVTSVDEDCLTLDITVPEAQGIGRPVLVWLHGGGGTNGSAAVYDPQRLAVAGDVVVVAPNFRLGVFGCFDHRVSPTAAARSAGSAGRAALGAAGNRAVRGDPANVTLVGESYGAP